MRKAAVSLTNGIAEGHGRFHFQDNIRFVRISRGSLEELLDDINVCIDEQYAEMSHLEALKSEGYELLHKINSYIVYLNKRKSESDRPKTKHQEN